MFSSAKATIATNSSGAATVFLTHGDNRGLNGLLLEIKYVPGTLDTGADLTITVDEDDGSQRPVMTKENAGTATVWFMPRAVSHAVADGAASTSNSELIPVKNNRIKVVVANGGDTKTGSIEARLLVNSPY